MNPAPRDYSFIAPIYDRIFVVPLAEGHQALGKLLKSNTRKNVMKVLEVGVGSGLTFNYLPENVEFVGVDINEKMLTLANQKAKALKKRKVTLKKMDAHKLNFKSNSFDLVLAPSVITAMRSPEQGMREIIRVTKKGGRIAIIANLRVRNSLKSDLLRLLDPLTRKYLGYCTNMEVETFSAFKGLKLLRKKRINSLMGMHLSWFMLFEKK